MKYKKIFLSTEFPEEKTAKTKAKVDVMEILQKAGYHTVYFPKVKTVSEIIAFWKSLSKIVDRNSHLVLEYPCYPRKRMWVIAAFKLWKRIKLFGVIHDIGDLRFTDPKFRDGNDMHFLKLYDGLVSHNYSMSKWLRSNGFKKPLVDLEVFDYLTEEKNFNETGLKDEVRVVYAGNLSHAKATYIYDKKLDKLDNIHVGLYGPFFEKERINGSRLNYKGMFDPQSPDLKEKYHFGLIWEGESTETCSGQMGQYIRFNNPHKFSLYVSLGLPVIVWKEAAIASFVLTNKIGVTIDSFHDLEKIGQRISEDEYREFCQNVQALSGKVRRGYFLDKAINKLVTI
jgi:hypothetical protein